MLFHLLHWELNVKTKRYKVIISFDTDKLISKPPKTACEKVDMATLNSQYLIHLAEQTALGLQAKYKYYEEIKHSRWLDTQSCNLA